MDDLKPLIHLVDQDPDHLVYLFDFLSMEGFPVAASSSTSDALKYIERMRPRIVLCEWEMPGMSGLELIDEVTRISPQLQVILMAQEGGLIRLDEVHRRGGVDLLVKPCRPRAVLRAVERIMEGVKR
jgi:DNA-binding NtrC family response regulator